MGRFTDDTAIIQVGPGEWATELRPGWRIGTVPNGGYILAIMGRALSAAVGGFDPLSINAFYMAPCSLGAATLSVDVLKSEGNTRFATVDLRQEGVLKVRATAALTRLDHLAGADWLGATPPTVPTFDDCLAVRAGTLEVHEHIDARFPIGADVLRSGKPDGAGEFVAWLHHDDRTPIEIIDLLMFADIMPPPAYGIVGVVGWVPTVELTVQCRGTPSPGPLLARVRAQYLTAGVIESDGDFWDSDGRLVALSRQTMKVRLPPSGAV